jgi:hypothetical protein
MELSRKMWIREDAVAAVSDLRRCKTSRNTTLTFMTIQHIRELPSHHV